MAAVDSEYFVDGAVFAASDVVEAAAIDKGADATGGAGADSSGESRPNRLDLIITRS